jgi:hypothetical protein
MEGHRLEVAVGRQKLKAMADRKACKEGVDRADLDAVTAAMVPERRGLDVILDLGHEDRQDPEFREDSLSLRRPVESLKELLDHEARRDEHVLPREAPVESSHFRSRGRRRAPQRQRPDAGVDENVHDRERSAL